MMSDSNRDGLDYSAEDLQTRIRHLEEWVCTLLVKNQTLRSELQTGGLPLQSLRYISACQAVTESVAEAELTPLSLQAKETGKAHNQPPLTLS